MQSILDGISSVSLILEAQEVLSIISKEDANLYLQAAAVSSSLLLDFSWLLPVMLHV